MKSTIARSIAATAVALAMFTSMSAAASAKKVNPAPKVGFEYPIMGQRFVYEPTTNATLNLPIVLDRKAPKAGVKVSYTIGEGTATAGEDFAPASGELLIKHGKKSATLPVRLLADTIPEDGETFTVRLTSASGAVIDDLSWVRYAFLDDDVIPTQTFRVTQCIATDFPFSGYVAWTAASTAVTGYRVEMYQGTTLVGWANTAASPLAAVFPLSTMPAGSYHVKVMPVPNPQGVAATGSCQIIVE